MNLLIVEDDPDLAAFLRRGFQEEGFDTATALDGEAGLEMALGARYDCLIVDWMMPGMDGVTLCRTLRARGQAVPILMLTVKDHVQDKVAGLEAGADDYLVKPFAFDELLARVHALLRRQERLTGHVRKVGDLEIDLLARSAQRGGEPIDLSPKEFALLDYLTRHAGRVISEEEMIDHVWGLKFDPQTNVVNVYLHRLRRKVDRPGQPPLIHTIRGRGFLFGTDS